MKIDIAFIKNLTDKNSAPRRWIFSLGNKAFLVFWVLILLEAILGEFLFYKYIFTAENREPEISTTSTQFKINHYQDVLSAWQIREQQHQTIKTESYQNPF